MPDHDAELESMRMRTDQRESAEPEKNSPAWLESLDAAFLRLSDDFQVMAEYILEGRAIPESIRMDLHHKLDEELARRAK
jgi:hypothetical protein